MNSPWGVHWFRRDLRVTGNVALLNNCTQTAGRTLGLFCFDSAFLSRPDFSANRFGFFLKTLVALKKELVAAGGDLLVVDAQPQDAFARILSFCGKEKIVVPSLVTFNRDYEPFARERDARVQSFLFERGVQTLSERDHLLFEPREILKVENERDFYKIFSPYGKKWFNKLSSDEGQTRIAAARIKKSSTPRFKMKWSNLGSRLPFEDALTKFQSENEKHVTITLPEAGFAVGYKRLKKFAAHLPEYREQRNIPSVQGTSKLSIFLKNGSLTTPQILSELNLNGTTWHSSNGATQFTKELAWREFYYSILFHRPDVENGPFLKQYEELAWQNSEAMFRKWQEGKTGFPIVDAGMRELLTTGWMHNRVRMIVASFLTKDLLIDWRWGERHFMKYLLDGDLAPNNGGWQWAASTGCDPQPYFRIFNPWLQSKRFDPDGIYIKHFVPELRDAPTAFLHDPEANRTPWGYPNPLVDHNVQRDKAIRLYKVSSVSP